MERKSLGDDGKVAKMRTWWENDDKDLEMMRESTKQEEEMEMR